MNESYKHIEAAASQAGVSYGEALAKIHAARQLTQQAMAKQGKEEVCEPPMGIDTLPKPRLPAWQDVLGDAEQLVRQKPTFSKYIKGTVLENDVPVWIADFAQRLLLRELTRIRAVIASDRCDGDTEYAAGTNAAQAKYLAAIDKR